MHKEKKGGGGGRPRKLNVPLKNIRVHNQLAQLFLQSLIIRAGWSVFTEPETFVSVVIPGGSWETF